MQYSVASAFVAFSFTSKILADATCGCYQTDAGDSFSDYQFIDFRGGKPSEFDTFFKPPLEIPVPQYGPLDVKNTMSAANIKFSDGVMSLTTSNVGGEQRSSDIYSQELMLYGSFRMYAQVIGSPGAVAGFFTYLDGNNEQDIEILTAEAENQIHFTTHVGGGASNGDPTLTTTMSASRSEFVTYRLDWTSGLASFYTNNDRPKNITQAVPTQPCTLDINMWSAGTGWGGAMAPGGNASFNIQWIEAVYNPTGPSSRVRRASSYGGPFEQKRQAGACSNPCKVDAPATPGNPVPA